MARFSLRASVAHVATALRFKAAVPAPVDARPQTVYGLLAGGGMGRLSPREAWMLYTNVGTLAKVVDLIADQVAALKPVVHEDGEPVDDHPIAQFLAKPGYNRTRRGLIKELAVQQLVTGTALVNVMGSDKADVPIALDVFRTLDMSHIEGNDGWPEAYHINEARRHFRFQRQGGRDYRYKHELLNELVVIYDMSGEHRGVGLSRLQAVRTDVDLKLKGLIHNRALMDKGARLSGALAFKSQLSQDQKEVVLDDLRKSAQGAHNAGAIMVTGGGEAEFIPFMLTPKDMDWSSLVKIVDESIIARYNVPITLFSVDAQTYSNYEAAWRAFYDNAVLPTFDIIYAQLAQMFSARLGREIEIRHDELTSNVLAKQAAERATELANAQLVTKNEAREIIGYEPVLGGDQLLGPPGMVAQFEDMFTPHGGALPALTPAEKPPKDGGKLTAEGDDDAARNPREKARPRAALN